MRPGAGALLWWLAVGALLAFGVVGILSIGVFLLAAAAPMIAVAAARPALRRSPAPLMALVGASAAPFTIAWLNREGPGTVCHTTATASSCAEEWSPWPFAAVGLLLVLVGVVAAHRVCRAARAGA